VVAGRSAAVRAMAGRRWAVVGGLLAWGWVGSLWASAAPAAPSAKAILKTAGVKGGLVVHVGCGAGRLTAALRVNESFVVHGLDTAAEKVETARRHIRSRGLYGKVSADTFDGRRLPYVDNLVNLLLADDLGTVPMAEVMRVLAPHGVALIGGNRTVKPWPDAIDEWTHYLHGPDNNALADDRVVGPPRHMQWVAGPRWTRHHHADKGTYPSVRAVVSAAGRLFYMVDETLSSNMRVPSQWFLAARDGFSGVLLWKKPLGFQRFERRLEGVWRMLVADGECVYASLGPGRPLSALDGATGKVVRDYDGTADFREMIKNGHALFLVSQQNDIRAVHVDTGNVLWRWAPEADDPLVPLTLAASTGKVFTKTDLAIWCFSATDGRVLWRRPLPAAKVRKRLYFPRERLLVRDGVVLVSYGGTDPAVLNRDRYQYLGSHPRVHDYGGRLAALSAEDGSELWRTAYLPGLEGTPGEIYVSGGEVWLGPDFAEPRDLHTGKVRRTRPVLQRLWTRGHHYRCCPGKATCRYVITAKRGIEMFDMQGNNHSRNNWVRATCRVGVTPCNGLIYAGPHSCGCYMEAKLHGFWALAPQRGAEAGANSERGNRLARGRAYGQVRHPRSTAGHPDGWWTYRGDATRSGSATSSVPSDLKPLWKTGLGGGLSAITVSDGKVFVAEIDAHTVHALDARSGEALWQFTAGGRVDSPPTLYNGLALFGAADGQVYCLRASDGELVWRFLAAPRRVSAVACEQVESLWPVHGSVLVRASGEASREGGNGAIAYAAAGRSSYLDGGIVLYGLDPMTGAVRCTRCLRSEHAGAMAPPSPDEQKAMLERIGQNDTDYKTFLAPDRSDAFSMRGALTDVMTADDESIFMRQMRFDAGLAPTKAPRQHLFATGSLLDGAEHHRAYWVLGTADFRRLPVAYPWIMRKSVQVPCGLMMAFDEKTVWGVHRGGKGRSGLYTLFATPRPDPSAETSRLPDFQKRAAKPKTTAGRLWTAELDGRPRAICRAGKVLLIGGEHPKQDHAGYVRVVSAADGKTLGEVRLDAPPVWDGMAAAGGRLYVSLRNGSVQSLGSQR